MSLDDLAFRTATSALGLKISNGYISHRSGSGPIAGARATVESSGDIERRITATRLVTLGVFALALRKKKDHRVLWVTIEGTGFQILTKASGGGMSEQSARRWVVRFNNLATALANSQG